MSEKEQKKKQLPLKPGLFNMPDDSNQKPYLTAQRCKACGAHFFSRRANCLNCNSEPMEVVPLGGRGKVFAFTVAWQQLPGALVKVPYGIAVIKMDEGCQVNTVVTEGWEKLKIGMDMEVYFEKMAEDPEGNDLLAYKFRAV